MSKLHNVEEIAPLVTPQVAALLDRERSYGIWWFNRRHTSVWTYSEEGPEGRRIFRVERGVSLDDRIEWIAVPMPGSGIPRGWVDAAPACVTGGRNDG